MFYLITITCLLLFQWVIFRASNCTVDSLRAVSVLSLPQRNSKLAINRRSVWSFHVTVTQQEIKCENKQELDVPLYWKPYRFVINKNRQGNKTFTKKSGVAPVFFQRALCSWTSFSYIGSTHRNQRGSFSSAAQRALLWMCVCTESSCPLHDENTECSVVIIIIVIIDLINGSLLPLRNRDWVHPCQLQSICMTPKPVNNFALRKCLASLSLFIDCNPSP